jgi:hypothetical protein
VIAVVEHFILCDELVALNHQMRFDDEIQLPQEFLGLLRAFDLDGSRGMAKLDLHERMIRPGLAGLQQTIPPSVIRVGG